MFDQMKKARALKKAMGQIEATGEAVNGMVKVTVDGSKELKSIELDPQSLTPENKEQLENAIVEAFNNCDKELQQQMIGKVQSGEISISDLGG
ncbi:YbaB/EbfC family nucleoid-associated protein [Patescibacteria group bacterium]